MSSLLLYCQVFSSRLSCLVCLVWSVLSVLVLPWSGLHRLHRLARKIVLCAGAFGSGVVWVALACHSASLPFAPFSSSLPFCAAVVSREGFFRLFTEQRSPD